MRAMPLRHAGVGLGDDIRVGAPRGHAEHGDEQVGGADAAIGAEGERRGESKPVEQFGIGVGRLRPIIVRPAVSKLAVAA